MLRIFFCTYYCCNSQASNAGGFPVEMDILIGAGYLFKIEKCADHGVQYDDSYKVKKVCENPDVIAQFKQNRTQPSLAKVV